MPGLKTQVRMCASLLLMAVVHVGTVVASSPQGTAAKKPATGAWRRQTLSDRATIESPGELTSLDVGDLNAEALQAAPDTPGRISKAYVRADESLMIVVGGIKGVGDSAFDAGDRLEGAVERLQANTTPDLRYEIRRQGASHATLTGSSVIQGSIWDWVGFAVLDGGEVWLVVTATNRSAARAAADARRVRDSFELAPAR